MAKRSSIDWFRVVCDLNKFTVTRSYARIALMTKIPASTIAGFKAGGEPTYTDGERLVDLWCRLTGGEREDLPKVSRFSNHF